MLRSDVSFRRHRSRRTRGSSPVTSIRPIPTSIELASKSRTSATPLYSLSVPSQKRFQREVGISFLPSLYHTMHATCSDQSCICWYLYTRVSVLPTFPLSPCYPQPLCGVGIGDKCPSLSYFASTPRQHLLSGPDPAQEENLLKNV